MAQSSKSLHAQNTLWLAVYIVFHFVAFVSLAIQGALDIAGIKVLAEEALSGEGAVSAGAFLIAVVLNGVLSRNVKAAVVFWRFRDSLPGHRAFTALGPNDPRVNMEALQNRLRLLPTAPRDQNVAWYRLYRGYRHEPQVAEAHRRYLLTRDIAVLTLLFAAFLPALLYLADSDGLLVFGYGVILFLMYLGSSLAAQHYGMALVTNVLAVASHD